MPNHILKKLLISVACLVFAAAIFTGRGEAQLKKVRMAVPGYTISMISFFAAKMNGYYAAEGLEVELIATRAPTANLAVLSGSVEFSAVPLAGLTTALRGGPLKVLFVHFDKPQHELFTKRELQDLKALRGKKIAVAGIGTIGDTILREHLTANGIDAGHDVTILGIGAPETRLASLLSGNVDASMLIAPYTVNAKEAGFRDLVVFKDHNFVLPSGGIVAREEILRSDPPMVEKFVRASVMGFLFSRDHRAESIKILVRNLKIDEPTATTIYDSSRPTMTVDGGLSAETQKRMVAFFTKIAPAKDVASPEKVFDFSFLRRAHATLQARGWKP
jgi:ABC-type nitrate/sulfonate/bicarbonate transport system substrate-binding protein